MVIIGPHTDRSKVSIRIHGQNFHQNLKLIHGIPGRKWDSEKKVWTAPIERIYEFSETAKKNDVVIISAQLQHYLDDYYHKINEIKGLKTKFDGIDFSPDLKIPLFPFQQVGVKFLYLAKRAILADVVGLGKTPQSIGISDKLIEEKLIDLSVIICPASLKKKWFNEFNKFSKLKSEFIFGPKKQRLLLYDKVSKGGIDHVILNYDLLAVDREFIIKMMEGKNVCLIGDEIQFIKNYKSQRTKEFIKLSKLPNIKYIYGLSATYIETGLENLYSIFKAIDPKALGDNYFHFMNRYLETDFFGKITGYKNVDEIKKILDPYVIRREKEQVIKQLPKRVEKDIYLEISKEQMKHYNEIKKGIVGQLQGIGFEKKLKIKAADILAQIAYLRQACLSAEILGGGNSSTKLDKTIEIVKGIKGKVVIFCYFKKMVEIIKRELETAGVKAMYMHADNCPPNQRQDFIDKFSNNGYKALCCSDILSVGQDITAADTLINFDLHWNPAKLEQRNGRIDRIGQKSDKITIINLIAEKTIEENIWEKVIKRTELIDEIVKDGFKSDRVSKLSIKQLVDMI